MEIDTFHRQAPTCPHCNHELNDDEMQLSEVSDADLYALAPDEESATVCCPVCDTEYWVHGGYRPYYTSAFSEEEL